MLYVRMRHNSLTLAIEEFVVAAGLGLSDDALHPPVRDLDVEIFVRIRRMQRHVLHPLLLSLFTDGRISITQLAFNPIHLLTHH